MRIALIHHSDDLTNDFEAYLATLLDNVAGVHNYLIKDYDSVRRGYEPVTGTDVLLHIVIPANSNFALKYWYAVKLPAILRKYAIEKVMCMYGITVQSTITKCLVLPDISFFGVSKGMNVWQKFAAKNLPKSIAAADNIITYSVAAKNKIAEKSQPAAVKTAVFPYSAGELFKPMEWHDKLYVKSRYSENKEYFVAILPDDNEALFTHLLKAYSKFKKWQQSNMQLVLLPKEDGFTSDIDNKLQTYKYRNDVKLVNDADKKETADIIATAYAMIHLPFQDSDIWPVTTAIQSSTPVITIFSESIKEYCGDAALYVQGKDLEELGNTLIKLYKDEDLRAKLSEKTAVQAEKLQQGTIKESLWNVLVQVK